jgi:hypothetical protein
MAAVQQHGFLWEDDIRTNVFHVQDAVGYTAIHDIPKEHNRFNPRETISIKVTGGTTICMGSALRLLEYDPNEQHTAIVIRYRQQGNEKRLVSVHELILEDRHLLFGEVTEAEVRALDALIRAVPPGPPPADVREAIHRVKQELNAKSGVVKFNPKLDTRTQRRLQCSIPRFNRHPALCRSSTTLPFVRGLPIRDVVPLGPRQFHQQEANGLPL